MGFRRAGPPATITSPVAVGSTKPPQKPSNQAWGNQTCMQMKIISARTIIYLILIVVPLMDLSFIATGLIKITAVFGWETWYTGHQSVTGLIQRYRTTIHTHMYNCSNYRVDSWPNLHVIGKLYTERFNAVPFSKLYWFQNLVDMKWQW